MYAILLSVVLAAAEPADGIYDVVVYGGTSAGISAGVQATRMNKSVVVVAPEVHLGGLTSGGLGWTDSGRKEAVGGMAIEYYRRVKKHYDKPDAWRQQKPEQYRLYHEKDEAIWAFEPHVAERVFEELVTEYKIPVHRNEWLDRSKGGVTKEAGKIVSFRTLSGKTYRGRVFIDATYEGDLMAAAGVTYTVGREANSQYGETLNGVQTKRAVSHQFEKPVDPYVVPGDPKSGLLPRIHAGSPGQDGEADKRLQAYCFRVCLTTAEDNRVPFEKPPGYDPKQYELLGRYLRDGWRGVFRKFDMIPNLKTDTNNHGAFSTDNIGMNYDYPDASYERRKEIIKEHEVYQKGLFYYIANDPSLPEDIRRDMSRWGLARDEFKDNGNWPHQIYVREARRMVSDFVMTERHLIGAEPTPDPVGMGSYNMDSHNVQRYVDASGHARNEGDIQISPGGPYPISYRAIVPKSDDCTNLIVPVCLSSSHIAYGSIRMEPVFLILGQSAATAAALAIDGQSSVQKVDYKALERRLLADHQVLDLPRTPKKLISLKSLPGVVVDDDDAELVGKWSVSATIGPYVGAGYRHDSNEAKGKKSATFRAKLEPGEYEVRVAYTANPNRESKIPVKVQHAGGEANLTLDQTKAPQKADKPFARIGRFRFDGDASVVISNEGTDGFVVIDAVQFLKPSR